MLPTRQGSIRLFRFAGIEVFLHWSWFVIALLEVSGRGREYSTFVWNVLEYVALFGIVLLHELGHALACRQVGGKADTIILWPLGGVAYVAPPPRPGPVLWSVAAGPLVNVVLTPFLFGVLLIAGRLEWFAAHADLCAFIQTICIINVGILLFNVLPIYPLDGGQILGALLWFPLGRARSLMVTASIGFVGVAGLFLLAFLLREFWLGVLAVFILLNCWRGLVHARALARAARLPRHTAFACPECHEPPIRGPFWKCGKCQRVFDTFEYCATCPDCGTRFPVTSCVQCGNSAPFELWIPQPRS